MFALARRNSQSAGVADRATFVQGDIFETDFTKGTVITMFLLPELNRRLMPQLLSLRPGTRVVSNSFPIGDWTPDQTIVLTAEKGCETAWCTAMAWIVPARVVGTRATSAGELALDQNYQKVNGTLKAADGSVVPVDGTVVGDEVVLRAGARELRGRVVGGRVTIP